jgi:hypothetical protein
MWYKWFFTKIGRYTILPLWSFNINFCVWIKSWFYTEKRKAAYLEYVRLKNAIKSVEDIERELQNFSWRRDRYIDWQPWICIFLFRGKRDDCDGAAKFTQWLFSLINRHAKIVILIGTKGVGNHAVVIAPSNCLYSNGKKILCGFSKGVVLDCYKNGQNEWGIAFYHRTA